MSTLHVPAANKAQTSRDGPSLKMGFQYRRTRTLSQSKRTPQVPFTGVSGLEPLPGSALAGNLYATQLFFACHLVAINARGFAAHRGPLLMLEFPKQAFSSIRISIPSKSFRPDWTLQHRYWSAPTAPTRSPLRLDDLEVMLR